MILGAWLLVAFILQVQPPCAGIEIVSGEEEYNSLVCEGKDFAKRGLYTKAVEALKAAAELHFSEFPNYKVLPLLAETQLLAGDRKSAEETLQIARLSLSVLAQVIACSDSASSPMALVSGGRRLESTAAVAAAERMCGGIYESYYERRPSLASFVRDAEVVEEFLRVEAEFRKRR
jgi:hypothetical protein